MNFHDSHLGYIILWIYKISQMQLPTFVVTGKVNMRFFLNSFDSNTTKYCHLPLVDQ